MIADNDFNIIKPVEGLQNIAGLAPTRRREQRKRRKDLHEEKKGESEQEPDNSVGEQELSDELIENAEDGHTIDYRA